MHNLVVSFLAVAYLAANVYAIVKVGVFECTLPANPTFFLPEECGQLLS
jgi:hypothetical protein